MPDRDKGIDAIVYDMNGNVYATQVKYRKIIDKVIPFGDHCTFQDLAFGGKVKNIYKGIFFTSCADVCGELKNDKIISIIYDSLNRKCNGYVAQVRLFWHIWIAAKN